MSVHSNEMLPEMKGSDSVDVGVFFYFSSGWAGLKGAVAGGAGRAGCAGHLSVCINCQHKLTSSLQ